MSDILSQIQAQSAGLSSVEDLKKQELRPVEVVGWLLHEDKDKVILISSYDNDAKTGGGGVVVPRVNITQLQLLNKGMEISF